jgi:hypothetical protein
VTRRAFAGVGNMVVDWTEDTMGTLILLLFCLCSSLT